MKSKVLISIVFFFLLVSCNCEVSYKSVTDLSKVRAKTQMISFEYLNDPIVITMPVYEKMAYLGNESLGSYSKRAGDIFVVYDWENNKIHDWLFFEGNHGWSNFRAAEIGNPVKYYDAGEKIGCLDKTGRLTIYPNKIKGTFANFNNNQSIKSRYGLINTLTTSNGKEEYKINLFDSETEIVDKKQLVIYSQKSYFPFPIADKNGDYWLTSVNDNKNYLNKIDCRNNKIESYNYSDLKNMNAVSPAIRGVFGKYVIISSSSCDFYPNIIIYDMDKEQVHCEIPLPKEVYPNRFFFGTSVNNKSYGIFPADHDNDDWCEWIDIYEIDIENQNISFCKTLEFNMTETIYSRGNRLYLLNSRNLSVFDCIYYDVKTGEIGSEFKMSLNDILNGKL